MATARPGGCQWSALAIGFVVAMASPGLSQTDRVARRQAVLAAEDARAPAAEDLETLRVAAGGDDEILQAVAVRALGRLERPGLLADIEPHLTAGAPTVRAQAANAVAQAVSAATGDAVRDAGRLLRDRLAREEHPFVRGIVASALGRLPYDRQGDVEAAEAALVDASFAGSAVTVNSADQRTAFGTPIIGMRLGLGGQRRDAPMPVLVGVAAGLEALVRTHARTHAPGQRAVARLRDLVVRELDDVEVGAEPLGLGGANAAIGGADDRVRRLALQALVTARAADEGTLAAALADTDWQVRRLAVLAAPAVDEGDALSGYLGRGLEDGQPQVRLEALRVYGRTLRQTRGCDLLVAAVGDVSTHVTLEAIDQLGACAGSEPAREALEQQVRAIDEVGDRFWHAAAHAVVSLARIAPDSARTRLPVFSSSGVWQVRMYAATAAAVAGDASLLDRLARDAHPNVRTAAIGGLTKIRGHDADDVFVAALVDADYQLVRAAARALAGSPAPDRALPALLGALDRLTREGRDTSRDPRVAILETVAELGDGSIAPAVWPYLADADPRIAALAARTLTAWTGLGHAPVTTRMAVAPAPAWREVSALDGSRLRLFLAGGGAFEIELHASEAPATVARIVRLARDGYYDGLTFHRVVPNFVIQGGSPGANEYVGDGPYMRDEVGLRPHTRGTVGISTRGRDTGDAQIFVNLVDNPRLDHAFTVFATVVRGLTDVDGVVEGARIERVEIVR